MRMAHALPRVHGVYGAAPEGWRRPDGSCQAHASIHRRQHVLEAVYAYKQRRERARRASA